MLRAIGDVPRRLFAPDGGDSLVDIDTPVPIPFGQTTSQPSTIALMVEALDLRPSSRVLEIGTGYGYE
ncbi:MAG: protein-L-isoaspartate O-methyltransferase, partial [Actinobacteria bacterium]|nr:protein-L-isoaspartate O-methyltransferase [Actinomycetota bacterium]